MYDYLLRGSIGWTILFFVVTGVAIFTQLFKTNLTSFIPLIPRNLLKAAPALLLAGLAAYFGSPILVVLGFLFCAYGDIFLDNEASWGFKVGGACFALALIFFSISYLRIMADGNNLVPLSLITGLIAIFILRWALPTQKGLNGVVNVIYFCLLVTSNIIASTSTVPIFLGSSLWLISDLSIALGELVEDQVNSLDTLGIYDLGLYFLAIGFII